MKVTKKLDDIAIVEQEPKSEGRQLFVMLAADAKKVKEYLKAKKAEVKAELKAEERAESVAKDEAQSAVEVEAQPTSEEKTD